MRTIKFRAIPKEKINNNKTEYFTLEDILRGRPVFSYPEHWHFTQFTGLLDKNGNEIYEGDIIDAGNSKVYFNEERGEWRAIGSKGDANLADFTYPFSHIVIGNIYENPELLTNQ